MPKDLRLPTVEELPEGPRRAFVVEMFSYYRACNRPTLIVISELIHRNQGLPGTASPETVRRILKGQRVPSWKTVESLFLVLCELAGMKPDEDAFEDTDYGGFNHEPVPSRRKHLNELWNDAKDSPLVPVSAPVQRHWTADEDPPF